MIDEMEDISSFGKSESERGRHMDFEDLKNPELQARLRACETAEELVGIFEAEGVELDDQQLAAVGGGFNWLMPDNDSIDVEPWK